MALLDGQTIGRITRLVVCDSMRLFISGAMEEARLMG